MNTITAYPLIRGRLTVSSYAPDGDSVRFVPDHVEQLEALHRGHALRVAPDGSVQLRFQGIDAPELHYAGRAQPLGAGARDRLLTWLGFAEISYATRASYEARDSDPHSIGATIVATSVDAHGRPIAYVLRQADTLRMKNVHGAREAMVDGQILEHTANAEMLRSGMAYPLTYTSMPSTHREHFAALAREAKRHRRGVWAHDETRTGFSLRSVDAVTVGGALVLPKLFRRLVDYFSDRHLGFAGTFKQWIEDNGPENDRVVLPANQGTSLSELLVRHGDRMWLRADLFDLTFVEQ